MTLPIDPVPIDRSKLSPGQLRVLDPKTAAALKQLAARGVAPGLKPHEALTVVAILGEAEDDNVRATAQKTLADPPEQLISGALTKDLDPGVVELIAIEHARNPKTIEKIVALPQIALTTVARVASLASEPVAELLAINEERLLKEPRIIENLYLNKATRMSTADRILEFAVRNKLELAGIPAYREAAAAIKNELIVERSEEPTFDDILFKETEEIAQKLNLDAKTDTHESDEETGEEKLKDDLLPVATRLTQMTISQKIRRATIGTSAERMILVRDGNKLVSQAAIKSPAIQENEVTLISANRTVSEDVLRIIANSREWTRVHQIKLNLVKNPRTPFAFAAKLIPHLREGELRELAKSKNVTGAVATAAKQQLNRKGK